MTVHLSRADGAPPPPPRIAYGDLDADPLVGALDRAAAGDDPAVAGALAAQVFTLRGGLRRALAERVVASTGPFATLARSGIDPDDPRLATAAGELAGLADLADLDWDAVLAPFGLRAPVSGEPVDDDAVPAATRRLVDDIAVARDWSVFAPRLAAFHRAEGTGALATHRVARFVDGTLIGVDRPDPVRLDDLVGDDGVRRPLADALAAFAAGAPAVDGLLYGPPGTGKSTAVRALAAAHPDVRLVQLDRRHVGGLGALFERLAGDGPRCLVLLDDLVFDGGDRADRELRAVLEGDVGARPTNVCVWATSNRMRLLGETRTEREDDLEEHLGRGERSALATRFGLRVAFGTLGVTDYTAMARELAARRVDDLPADFDARARRFAVDRGLSPRSARQFADIVAGEALVADAD